MHSIPCYRAVVFGSPVNLILTKEEGGRADYAHLITTCGFENLTTALRYVPQCSHPLLLEVPENFPIY